MDVSMLSSCILLRKISVDVSARAISAKRRNENLGDSSHGTLFGRHGPA